MDTGSIILDLYDVVITVSAIFVYIAIVVYVKLLYSGVNCINYISQELYILDKIFWYNSLVTIVLCHYMMMAKDKRACSAQIVSPELNIFYELKK